MVDFKEGILGWEMAMDNQGDRINISDNSES